jgi:pimeloyl-ACP methyl ester carboxylesterase
MIDFKNKIFEGSNERKSLFDCTIEQDAKAVVIFVHGYKGYKDWGAWNLMQKSFVDAGFGFVKFNMSHNGGTVDEPIDFPDLEAFGQNRYSYELFDLEKIITETHRLIHQELEIDIPIYLLGHSRGGGVVVLQSAIDDRVAKVVSLAGISDIGGRFPTGDALKDWKNVGVNFVENGRTKQSMPHYFSFYEDFVANEELLDIERAASNLKIPFLQIHGDMDQSVSISEGIAVANWTDTEVKIIKGGEHTFGTKQPWESNDLPEEMKEVVAAAVEFFSIPII